MILLGSSEDFESAGEQELLSRIEPYLTLEDYGLSVLDVPLSRSTEIRSERVFVDEAMAEAIQSSIPDAQPVITYLANTLRVGGMETPYSMVTAVGQNAAPFWEAICSWGSNDNELARGRPGGWVRGLFGYIPASRSMMLANS